MGYIVLGIVNCFIIWYSCSFFIYFRRFGSRRGVRKEGKLPEERAFDMASNKFEGYLEKADKKLSKYEAMHMLMDE